MALVDDAVAVDIAVVAHGEHGGAGDGLALDVDACRTGDDGLAQPVADARCG